MGSEFAETAELMLMLQSSFAEFEKGGLWCEMGGEEEAERGERRIVVKGDGGNGGFQVASSMVAERRIGGVG